MIDVVMPTYNRIDSLRSVIQSYMTQENLGKFIIVDDFSAEDVPSFVKEMEVIYPDKIIYKRMDKKTTLPNIRNVGIELAKNEYIFMGEDDVLLPKDHFKILLEKMKEFDADLIAGRRIYLRTGQSAEEAKRIADLDKSPLFVRIPFEGYFERYIERPMEVCFLHSNILMKRNVFEKVQYDPAYGGNAFREELDFFLRVHDEGFHLWIIPDTLSYHLKGTAVNIKGGSRKKRIVYEFQVWKNTIRCFFKNRKIFKKEFKVKNIFLFTLRSLLARYSYAIKRRISWYKK